MQEKQTQQDKQAETKESNKEEKITFNAYSLVDVLEQTQKLVQQGYELDLDSNSGYPQQFGTVYVITMNLKNSLSIPVSASTSASASTASTTETTSSLSANSSTAEDTSFVSSRKTKK